MGDVAGGAVERIAVDGVELAYRSYGDSGPLAVCLHGFPDSAHTWRYLGPRLADAGYRVVAPFMRGYAPSSVAASGHYQPGALASDAIALHEALGGDGDAVIIGHDWGASATYGAIGAGPDRWRAAVAMAVPPAGAIGPALLGNHAQLRRSWYMFFFQHALADVVVAADDLQFLDGLWADWSPGYDAADDLVAVKDALREPDHLAAALGYYRAALGDGPRDPEFDAIEAAGGAAPPIPTLYLHGADDGCIGVEVAESARALVPAHVEIEVVDGVGHFLHLERPDAINTRIVDFLTSTP